MRRQNWPLKLLALNHPTSPRPTTRRQSISRCRSLPKRKWCGTDGDDMSLYRTESHSQSSTDSLSDRREHLRIRGPFDGRREGLMDTPVRVYDLSRGGCFITSLYEQPPGIRLTLHIDLPGEVVFTLLGETLAHQNEFGFAVKFVD